MTEDEAKTRWCPFVRFVPETDANYAGTSRGVRLEREAKGAPQFKCIGSACMAWREAQPTLDQRHDSPDRGYCGIAGKPT